MKRILATMALASGALLAVPLTARAQVCADPTVVAVTFAEAAVSRPALAAPSEYPVSNVYSLVEQVTKPTFSYAEAGPQYAGAFEALAPAGTPPPPRAASAYPSEDIPDEDEEVWGGVSRTEVSAISAFATSSGAQGSGIGEGSAGSSRSWAVTRVDCDVVTLVAGWEANNVTLAPGAFVEQMGQTVTLVVGPDGSSSEVETVLVGAEGVAIPSEGRPAGPFTDPVRDNGGPTLDAGEPRTEVGDDHATASGGGFHFFFGDPESGQGAGYSIGGLNARIEVLGPVEPVAATAAVATTTTSTAPAVVAPRASAPPRPAVVGTDRAVTGTPPPPATPAIQAADVVAATVTDDLVSLVSVEHRNWMPLYATVGLAASIAALVGATAVGRHRYLTLEWIARRAESASSRFAAVYLRW